MIDPGLPSPWPPEVLDAVAAFRQGHLVERPPVFYAAAPAFGVWDLTREAGAGEPEELFELAEDERPEYGIVVTQTCDLVEEGRPDHPWFQVAPVYRVDDPADERLALLRDHRISHLVLLEPPALDGVWVADLRIEIPLEKSWLASRIPIEAFGSEEAYQVLAERLAARRDRPALDSAVTTSVVRPLRNWLSGNAGRREAAKVSELRLAVAPSRLEVHTAGLLVLTNAAPLGDADRTPWDRWRDRTRKRAADAGVDLLGNAYESYQTLSAAAYRNSVPLDFRYLSRDL